MEMKQITISIDDATEKALSARSKNVGHTLEQAASDVLAQLSLDAGGERECRCGGLELASQDPSIPVEFDAETNEYEIVKKTDSYESRTLVRFCFHCGGRAPASRRASLFETVDKAEMARLSRLFNEITTIDEAIDKFGPPDQDLSAGVIISDLGADGAEYEVARSVIYNKISKVADIRLTVRKDGKITIGFSGKPRKIA
jgi:hypothetical protein